LPIIPTATNSPGSPSPTPIPCPRLDSPIGSFIHTANASNTSGHITITAAPALYCQPNAILRVTPNRNPSGGAGVYNNHPIGVYYIGGIVGGIGGVGGGSQRWAILNQDHAAMTPGASFNVTYT
jgi:hypothetical protein